MPAYHQLCASVLGTVASWIVGNAATVHDLVRYVNQTLVVPSQCPIMGWWASREQLQCAPIEFTSSTDPLESLAGTGMSNDMGPAEEILQDGWTDVEPAREGS